ncbi:MAG: hypothetical protein JOS17DRAFT_837526 [Linnemannia elongata]|nr:MAG: hypothetical protein JOS17DRAFT_837526 [Linnemannia elongata]
MAMARALEMAEIAHLVGLNVSLLDPSTGALIQKKSYTPQTLLNCCLVSKSWRLILLPILWRCYDDRHMGIVPRHIIVQNRSFFRYFSGQVMPLSKEEEEREKKRHMRQSRHQDMDCRSLLDLEVFFDKFVHRFNLDDSEASELGRFLRPVSTTLKTLYLVGLKGGCCDPTAIWLPQATDLTVDVSDGSETRTCLGLQELLTRCPSLQRLSILPLDLSTKLD